MGSIHPTKNRYYSKHTRIDPNQSYQVAYWKQRFGISEEALIDAVRATGGLARNVEAYLREKRASNADAQYVIFVVTRWTNIGISWLQ
jgi:Protein of unknown function (DUF3606)